MSDDLRVSVTLGSLPAELADSPRTLTRAVQYAAVLAGTNYLWRKLASNTPKGATGKARQSVHGDVSKGLTIEGFVGYAEPASGYIIFPQEGTRPHWPPIAPLAYWAQRKFGLSADNARRVGYLIARKISRAGVKRQDFVGKTAREERERTQRIMAAAAGRAARDYRAGR